jgi:subtilisin family serine protease
MVYNEYKDYVLFFERNKQVKISSNTCRSNQGSNGFRGGYFSWGVDVIDTRTLNSDNRYCPYNNLNGLGVDVFILDTGLVYPLPSDINANKVTREFDAYQTVQDSFCQDRNGHGTSTAGLIISDIYGVSPNVNLRVYKVLNNNGVGSIADIIDALLAITSGYNDGIISLSIGLYDENTRNPSPALTHVIQSMMTNFIFVIASGNDAKDSCYNYPSNIPGAISVGAITNTKEMAYFTNYGECVSIFSPGVGIVSNGIDNDQYSIYSGSSQATPIVSGVIALYKQYYSGFSNQYIITKVNEFATLNSITKIRPSTANKVIFVGDFRSDNRGVPTQSPSDSFENNNSNNKEILLLLFIITIGAFVLIY